MTRKKNKIMIVAAGFLALVLALAGCDSSSPTQSDLADITATGTDMEPTQSVDAGTAAIENQASHFDGDEQVYDVSEVVSITLDGATAVAGRVAVEGGTITISAAGVYSLKGVLEDGAVIVDAADEDVTLILEGVDITHTDGAAIAVIAADEVTIILASGSTNRLTDGASYSFPDAGTYEPNAALFASSDLTIAGDGELIVDANFNDGITSKDGLVIKSGTIVVVAADDGIRGKDYVIVDGGSIVVEAGGDGIKADNGEDADRGYVLITGGVVDITSGDDGVQGATDVLVTGGALTVDAGSGSGTGRALQGDVMVGISGGVIDATAVDDAIHSNNEITIGGGTLTLASGDDGVHGDYLVTINGGSITITESYEGIESEVVVINDGFINITSNDDGLNVASADVTNTTNTPPVRGPGGDPGGGGGVGEHYIYIHGGVTVITITGDLFEQGDGIDANGHVEMTGGVVAVSGPTDTRNSAIDYSGGTFEMSGGLFIGTNIDGRNSEGIGTGSTQASLYVTFGSRITAGTVVHIESTDGEGLVTFVPANDYNVIVFSSPDLVGGESHNVYLGGAVTGNSITRLYGDSEYTGGELASTVMAANL